MTVTMTRTESDPEDIRALALTLLDVASGAGGLFLLRLLEGEATERQLRTAAGDLNQSAANRLLTRFSDLGLAVSGEGGNAGRRWRLTRRDETFELLRTATVLAFSIQGGREAADRAISRRLTRIRRTLQ